MTKVRVSIRKVGISIDKAIEMAKDYAEGLEHFRVQAFKLGSDWPITSWSTCAGDDVMDIGKYGYTMKDEMIIRRNINTEECDMFKVLDDNTGRTIATILVNG